MKTTIDIPDGVLREAMKHADADTKRDAVLRALEEFNRKHRQRKLIRHMGKSKTFMTHAELMKLREMN